MRKAGSLLQLRPFFGAHWQLGSIATVFAVLRFGWWGVLVGSAEALAETWTQGTWCFPVLGCVGYRGYFQRAPADQLAAVRQAVRPSAS
jgi:hypothetical protein